MEDLEREVVVVYFLPAGRLEDPAKINKGNSNLDEHTTCCCFDTISEFYQ